MDRKKELQCAGVPFHAANMYIAKLIEKGYKVAICEQVEDPKQAKGMVKREVIRVVTPGTVLEDNLLEEKKNNYIMSVYKQGIYFGISVCDISTGEFLSTEIKSTNNFVKLLDEIARYGPSEIVVNEMLYLSENEIGKIRERIDCYISNLGEENFKININNLKEKYNIIGDAKEPLKNLEEKTFAVSSIAGLLAYIKETQKGEVDNIYEIKIYKVGKYVALDINARRNLELTERMRDKGKKGTLLWVLDKTSTSMGGRLLRRWINDPILDIDEINARLDSVNELKTNMMLKGDIIESLKQIFDIERIARKNSFWKCKCKRYALT